MKCTNGHEIKLLNSAAGYYFGTKCFDEDVKAFVNNCRCSGYYPDIPSANKAKRNGDISFRVGSVEIEWCHKGKGCVKGILYG